MMLHDIVQTSVMDNQLYRQLIKSPHHYDDIIFQCHHSYSVTARNERGGRYRNALSRLMSHLPTVAGCVVLAGLVASMKRDDLHACVVGSQLDRQRDSGPLISLVCVVNLYS